MAYQLVQTEHLHNDHCTSNCLLSTTLGYLVGISSSELTSPQNWLFLPPSAKQSMTTLPSQLSTQKLRGHP